MTGHDRMPTDRARLLQPPGTALRAALAAAPRLIHWGARCDDLDAECAALAAAGIGPGDEVLGSTLTNMASFFAVLYLGARPVPVDIDADTADRR